MKYANYRFSARELNNLGDNMQLIAVDSIYGRMGIPKEDIIYIDKNEIGTYKGEYVVLPVTMPLVDYTEGGITGRFSDYIITVFIGLTLVKDKLSQAEVDYYHRYGPIGCRDERTMNTLRNYGIKSYLHGCVTATLPKRISLGKKFEKIFIVDISNELISYIPKDILDRAEFVTHFHRDISNPKEMALECYKKYKDEAKLVITSLLHCSVPCLAAGIPTILAKNHISYRFGWLEKLLPLYDENDFSNINWNPSSVNYENHKERLLQFTINQLRNTYNKYNQMYKLSYYYEHRDRKEYIVDAFEPIKQYIDKQFIDHSAEYKYSIWGLSQISELVFDYISKRFSNAKLMHVYDTYRRIKFKGLYSETPDNIQNNPDEMVLVTVIGASKMAQTLFKKIGKREDSYFIMRLMY